MKKLDRHGVVGWCVIGMIIIALLLACFSCEKDQCYTFEINETHSFTKDSVVVHEEFICTKQQLVCDMDEREAKIYESMNTFSYIETYDGCVIVDGVRYHGILIVVKRTCWRIEL